MSYDDPKIDHAEILSLRSEDPGLLPNEEPLAVCEMTVEEVRQACCDFLSSHGRINKLRRGNHWSTLHLLARDGFFGGIRIAFYPPRAKA